MLHMGNFVPIDSKLPSNCWYMSWPSWPTYLKIVDSQKSAVNPCLVFAFLSIVKVQFIVTAKLTLHFIQAQVFFCDAYGCLVVIFGRLFVIFGRLFVIFGLYVCVVDYVIKILIFTLIPI